MKMEVSKEEPKRKKLRTNNKLEGDKKKKVELEKKDKLSQKNVPKSEEIVEKRRQRRKEKKIARQNKKNSKNKPMVVVKMNNIGEKLMAIVKNDKDNEKTKINHFKNLLNKIDEKNLEEFVLKLKEIILEENIDDGLKIYLINNLTKLINLSFYQNNFEVFLVLAKFCIAKFINQNDSNDLNQNFKNPTLKLITLLINNVINKKTKECKKEVLETIYKIMKFAYKLNEEDEIKIDSKESLSKIFKKIFSSYKQIELNETSEKKKTHIAFFIFYVFLCINFFNENELTLELFLEMNECFKRFNQDQKKDEKPYWSDVFTDILLSLLSKPNNFKRAICDEVFSLIADKVTGEGLDQLMTALLSDSIEDDIEENSDENKNEGLDSEKENSDEEKLDNKENKDNEEDSSDEEDLDMEIDENLKDVDQNFKYNEDEDSENEEASDESETDEDNADESESEVEDVDEDLRNKIKLALGKAAADDDDDNDDLVFNDEQMFELDDAIANVFKEKKKVQEKNKVQDLNEFKSRCFDLVLILINTKSISLDFLLKTAKTIIEVLSKNFKNNCYDLLLKASSTLKKYPSLEKINLEVKENYEQEIKSLVDNSLKLSVKMPEKIRNNLNNFIVWILDLSKNLKTNKNIETIFLNEVEFIFDNKKINLLYFYLTILERKKNYSEQIFNELIKLNVDLNLANFKISSYYRLINECFKNLENQVLENKKSKNEINKLLSKSLDILEEKKNDKKFKVLIEEIMKFIIIYIKNYKESILEDKSLKEKLKNLKEELNIPKLKKKFRQKWNSSIKLLC